MSEIICYDSKGNLLKSLYQWDHNQRITIKGVDDVSSIETVHFSNRHSKEALVVKPTKLNGDIIADVPNILLQNWEPIVAYITSTTVNEGYKTVFAVNIPVIPRSKPSDYEYVENIEYLSWVTIEAEARAAIQDLKDNAIVDAVLINNKIVITYGDGSKYESDSLKPIKGVDYFTEEDRQGIISEVTDEAIPIIKDSILDGVSEDFDTLKEVADWIAADTTDSAKLIERVTAVEERVEDILSIEEYIIDGGTSEDI